MKKPEPTCEDIIQHLLAKLRPLREAAKEHAVRAGLKSETWEHQDRAFSEFTEDELIEVIAWQVAFNNGPLARVLEIWTLKPPEWWHNLVHVCNTHDTRGQLLLKAAQKELRLAWKKRPLCLRANYKPSVISRQG